jgi:hypothetical protein
VPVPVWFSLARQQGSWLRRCKFSTDGHDTALQDIDPQQGAKSTFENVEQRRVQSYPQVNNEYEQEELVLALWPLDSAMNPSINAHWSSQFFRAVFLKYSQDRSRAKIRFENDDHTLDHQAQPQKCKPCARCPAVPSRVETLSSDRWMLWCRTTKKLWRCRSL